MKKTLFSLLISCLFGLTGCGDNSKSASDSDSKSSGKGKSNTEKVEKTENAKIDSSLPFKDVDPTSAPKGIDPGRILIDVAGKDSAGQPLALSDYKGKVILLDTWASW